MVSMNAVSRQALKTNGRLSPKHLILYADKRIVVLNKPAGLVSQLQNGNSKKSGNNSGDVVFREALQNVQNALNIEGDLKTVHRLDKPTTGAFLLARTQHAAKDLATQIKQRAVEKSYLALVCGAASDFPAMKGTMEHQLECRDGRIRMLQNLDHSPPPLEADGRGEYWTKEARSAYEVLATSPKVPLSLVRLELSTGFKHQLRVGLSQYLRTPVLGDTWYGSEDKTGSILRSLGLKPTPFMHLHSSQFAFKRYSRELTPKGFKFSIGAPLHGPFIKVCQAAEIPLHVDLSHGGVWINGVKVRGVGAMKENTEATQQVGKEPQERQLDAIDSLRGVWYGPS
ncbi:pseudouridine synthase [Cubamyces sp. BRFM 1775]|nr:pseudouridine synthase [Cubamyces sp. BRFM 1775]